jgi:type II secretion system protein C
MKILNYGGFFYAAALAVFLAFFLGNAARYLLIVPPLPSISGVPARADEAAARENLALSVAERNIFDIDRSVPLPEQNSAAVPGQSGQTPYNAVFDGRLTGIFMGTDGKDVRAIILKNNKDVLVLKQGLPTEDYTLKSVEGEAATVNHGGTDYKLELQDGLKSSAAAASATPSVRGAQPPRSQSNTPVQPATEGTENITLNRSDLTGQLKDINKVISTLLASPAYVDKELVGYRIVRMQNESPVRQLGIQPGDIINRINGEELTNPQILFNMLQQAADISAISVDITRNGTKKTLFVEIQ